MICLIISFLQAFEVEFLKQNMLGPAFYFLCGITRPFPICQRCFSLGIWHSLFPGKESHFIRLYQCLKKSVKSHMPFQEEGKDLSSCFFFLTKMPSFHCLLQLHILMESACIYNPLAVELNYPGTQVKLLPVIRRCWYGLWNQLFLAARLQHFLLLVLVRTWWEQL